VRNKQNLNKAKQKIINDILANITLGEITILILEKAQEKAERELSKMNESQIKDYLNIVETANERVLDHVKPVPQKDSFFTKFKNTIINLLTKKEEPGKATPEIPRKKLNSKPKSRHKKATVSRKAVLSKRKQNKKG